MNILPHILAIIGLLLAIVIGTLIAEGRNTLLAIGIGLPLLYFFVKTAGAYWILIGLLYSTIGIEIQPIGPRLEPIHIVLALVCVYLFANFWRPAGESKRGDTIRNFRPFLACFAVLLSYTIGVSVFHTLFPHAFMGDSLRNLLKQQTAICGGFLIIAITLLFQKRFTVGKKPINQILLVFCIGLLFNIALRLYGIFILKIGEVDVATGQEVPYTAFFIPGINATDNVFILRFLSPISACLSACILTSKCPSNKKPPVQFLAFGLFLLSIAGSVISQGRISVFLSIMMISLVLFVRGKLFFLVVMAFFSIFLLFGIKLAFEYDARILPAAVQRTFGWLPFMRSTDARANLDSSTNWRGKLFETAFSEITTSSRILLLGRGVYAFTERDAAIIRLDGFDGAIEVNRRRATTHNLLTDVILTNGTIGLFLYLITYGALLFGIYRAWKNSRTSNPGNDIALTTLITTSLGLVYALFGGGFIQVIEALLISSFVVIISKIRLDENAKNDSVSTQRSFVS